MVNPPLILLVEDDPNFREIFKAKLESTGFRVELAVDGEEGIQKTRKLMPKLVLMDVQMPGMSGVEAMIKIKEDEKTENVQILFLSALGDPRTEVQEINRRLSEELSAVGYLRKTDDLDYLVGYIKNFLQ